MASPNEPGSFDPEKVKSKDVPWYRSNIDDMITPELRNLLETYSRVPPAEVSHHVHAMRDEAWAIRSYRYTGIGAFLAPLLPLSSAYPSILRTLCAGSSFLDIGCFIGHDLRRLVFDGAPSDRLSGINLVSHWDVGYDMFRDRDRFLATFAECDIFHPSADLVRMAGETGFDVIALSLVLHLWDWEGQIDALKQVVRIAGSKGTVVGFQVGHVPAKVQTSEKFGGKAQFWHDLESFQRLWTEVGEVTGTKWDCESSYKTWEECRYTRSKSDAPLGESAKMMEWVARRVDGKNGSQLSC